jgi:RNA polymerase sigma factor (sigma-70 family)
MSIFTKRITKLLEGCKANQRTAQEALYKFYYEDMLKVCRRYLKSDQLAQEALNTGFLKVFEHINQFDAKKGEPGAWINTIMVRTCIDLSRKEARFIEQVNIHEVNDAAFIAPAVLEKLYAEDLLRYIRALPAATQLVFNLSVLEGYSHQEIGEQLNIKESTSRWHLSEARKQLKAMLEPAVNEAYNPTEKSK